MKPTQIAYAVEYTKFLLKKRSGLFTTQAKAKLWAKLIGLSSYKIVAVPVSSFDYAGLWIGENE